MASRSYRNRSGILPLFLIGLLILLASFLFIPKTKTPREIIQDTLSKAGYPQKTIDYWIAISAFETANWTSTIFLKYNNLWGMTFAGKDTTAIGVTDTPEKQASYSSVQSSADDIILFMQKRWNYPKEWDSLSDLITYMKQRSYFTASSDTYLAGVTMYYNKFFA